MPPPSRWNGGSGTRWVPPRNSCSGRRRRRPTRSARAWGRRAFLGTTLGGTAAAAIAAVVAPPFGLWRSFDEWDADYRTDTGGRRQFGLDRQVQVDMNTQTSIALRPDVRARWAWS